MVYEFDKGSHSIYTLTYHLIICVKYRKKVLVSKDIVNTLKQQNIKISQKFGIKIINQEVDKDHIHILFSATPKSELTKYINILKGTSSRILQRDYPEIKQQLWNGVFWSPSYCLITTGQVTLDRLIKYVEDQGK